VLDDVQDVVMLRKSKFAYNQLARALSLSLSLRRNRKMGAGKPLAIRETFLSGFPRISWLAILALGYFEHLSRAPPYQPFPSYPSTPTLFIDRNNTDYYFSRNGNNISRMVIVPSILGIPRPIHQSQRRMIYRPCQAKPCCLSSRSLSTKAFSIYQTPLHIPRVLDSHI